MGKCTFFLSKPGTLNVWHVLSVIPDRKLVLPEGYWMPSTPFFQLAFSCLDHFKCWILKSSPLPAATFFPGGILDSAPWCCLAPSCFSAWAPGYLEREGINKPFPTSHLWMTLDWLWWPLVCNRSTRLVFLFKLCVYVSACAYRHTHTAHTRLKGFWRTNQLNLWLSNQKKREIIS